MEEAKASIRSILLSIGKRATEREFRSAYFNLEGDSFTTLLQVQKKSFYDFMKSMPDVCHVWKVGDSVEIMRVSTEESQHMDNLTIAIKKKKKLIKSNFGYNTGYSRPILRSASFPNRTPPSYRPQNPNLRAKLSGFQPKPQSSLRVTLNNNIRTTNVTKGPSYNPNFIPPHMRPTATKTVYKPIEEDAPPEPVTPSDSISYTPPIKDGYRMRKNSFDTNSTSEDSRTTDVDLVDDFPKPLGFNPFRKVTPEPSVEEVEKPFANLTLSKSNPFLSELRAKEVKHNDSMKENEPNWENLQTIPGTSSPVPQKPLKNEDSNLQKRLVQNALQPVCDQKFEDSKKNASIDFNNNKTAAASTESRTVPFPQLKEIKTKKLFEITIREVNSPSQFMFQFGHEELARLMEELNAYYSEFEMCTQLRMKQLKRAMPVAAFFEGNWCRGEVMAFDDKFCCVWLFDIGKGEYINRSNLRILCENFLDFPRMCCKGSLFGVQPTNGDTLWDPESIFQFMKLTYNRKVYATVKQVDENDYYKIEIIHDIIDRTLISNLLVEGGFAGKLADATSSMSAILV